MYPWTYVFTTMEGKTLDSGEVRNPDGRRFSAGLKRAATAGLTVRADDPVVQKIRAEDFAVRLKVYYGAGIQFHGQVINYQRVSEGGKSSISFTATDPYGFYFPKRLLNHTTANVTYTSVGRGALAATLIEKSELDMGNQGASPSGSVFARVAADGGAYPNTGGSTITYALAPWKPVNEVIAELAAGINGFEWRIMPTELNAFEDDDHYVSMGDWYSDDVIGSPKPAVIFENNIGLNNVIRAEEVGDLTTAANYVYHIAETGPDAPGSPVVEAENTLSEGVYDFLEDIAQAQITDLTLRQQLVNDHVAIRGGFRKVFSIQPAVYDSAQPFRVPQYGRDFTIGDTIRARMADAAGIWFDGDVRVWAVEVAPDRLGKSVTSLTLVEE